MLLCPKCHAENLDGAEKCVKCGAPLIRIVPAHLPVDDEFELQDAPKSPERQPLQGPAEIDLDALAAETDAPAVPGTPVKKPKKAAPERPKDYKRESQILMSVLATLLLLPLTFCLFGQTDFCGHGLPNIIGLIFGGLAMLESMKVDEYYKAEDYEGADKASADARRYLKIGIIAAVASLVILVSIQVAYFVFNHILHVVSPKTDLP